MQTPRAAMPILALVSFLVVVLAAAAVVSQGTVRRPRRPHRWQVGPR